MVGSGNHILNALRLLSDRSQAPTLGPAIEQLAQNISRGQRLSESMRRQGPNFSPLEVALVRVGEDTGSLHGVLERLAHLTEKRQAQRQKLVSSLTYPAFVIVLCGLLLILAPAYVFSDLLDVFRQNPDTLPLATKVYLVLNDLLTSPLVLLLATATLGGILGFALSRYRQDPELRGKVEEFALKIPGLGEVLKNSICSELCRALSVCYRAGLPILSSLTLCREATWSALLGSRLERAQASLKNGSTVCQALEEMELLPKVQLSLLVAGEESGKLGETLDQVADQTAEEMEYAIEQGQSLLEPLVLVVVGSVVGFLAIAIMSPMLKVVEQL